MSESDLGNAEMQLVNPQDIFKDPPTVLKPPNLQLSRQNSFKIDDLLTDEDSLLQLFM